MLYASLAIHTFQAPLVVQVHDRKASSILMCYVPVPADDPKAHLLVLSIQTFEGYNEGTLRLRSKNSEWITSAAILSSSQ